MWFNIIFSSIIIFLGLYSFIHILYENKVKVKIKPTIKLNTSHTVVKHSDYFRALEKHETLDCGYFFKFFSCFKIFVPFTEVEIMACFLINVIKIISEFLNYYN